MRDLAQLIADQTGVEVSFIENPRSERDENDLYVANDQFLEHGLEPIILVEGIM